MYRYVTFTWIILILSIIDFARAAPVQARGVHEVHVNVVEDGTATSQKRMENNSPLPRPGTPNYNPIPLVPDYSWLGRLPVDSSQPPSPDGSWTSYLPAEYSQPPSPEDSWLSRLSVDDSQPPSPDGSWLSPPADNPNSQPPSPDNSWSKHLAADDSQSSSPDNSWSHLAADKLNSQPPSPDNSWSSRLVAVQPLPVPGSLTGPHQSTDDHPLPSPEPPNPASVSESGPADFLDLLLKGKIRRRTAGSSAVDSAQSEVQAITVSKR